MSVDGSGRQFHDGTSFWPSLSGDGQFLAFTSSASLGREDPDVDINLAADIFVFDRARGITTRISADAESGCRAAGLCGALLTVRWLAFTWPVPAQRIERREDGIIHDNKSRAVDMAFIATVSTDKAWVIASFARTAGNVWSNPELTCQHVDPQTSLSPGQRGQSR